MACLRRRAGGGAAHRAFLRLARFALSARGGRGLCHRARLWLSPAELHGRTCARLLGADIDRHAEPSVRRQCRRPVRPRGRAVVVARARFSVGLDRSRVPRHPRVDVGQCAVHAGRGGRARPRRRGRRILLGVGRLSGDPGGARDGPRRAPGHAGRGARLFRVHRLRGHDQRRRGNARPGAHRATRAHSRHGRARR